MAFYLLTTSSGQVVREAISIRRMLTSAAHEFPSGVLEVTKLAGAAALARCAKEGVPLPQAAKSELARLLRERRSQAAWRRSQKVREETVRVREGARQAAAAEKERIKKAAAAEKRRESARLKRAEKAASTVSVSEVVPLADIEATEWDGEAAPWD